LYEGIGLEVDSHNPYLFTILKGDDNTYSINPKNNNFYGFGDRIKLVTGYQARNNRRVVISGSINLCSNAFYYLRFFQIYLVMSIVLTLSHHQMQSSVMSSFIGTYSELES
jgi:hypothetical protein